MSNVVIEVDSVSKEYRLGTISSGTLYRDMQSWWARLRGLEDPNQKIGVSSNRGPNVRFNALEDVSFSICQGDILGIVGRNGAGKSTLLKIISRITAPTKGTVKIKGRINSLLEVGTGFHPELTGRENIYLNGAIHGMKKREIDKKFDQIVEFSEIGTFIDTPVKRYSSGMYVRLAFSVAAHLDSEILIIDEVLAVGDARFQKKCLGKMEEVGKGGRTVLFVSHNLPTVSRLCSRGILLDKGRIVSTGSMDLVIKDYIEKGLSQKGVFQKPVDLDKDISFTEIRTCRENGATNHEFQYNEPVRIVFDYQVNNPVKNAALWVRLETIDSVRVFESFDYDGNSGILEERARGQYTTSLVIPSHLLNVGTYKLFAGLYNFHLGQEYESLEALAFDITEIGHLDSELRGRNTRTGIIQPRLDWETKRL
ncbi:MAG: ABC transporter ATP-binding protein [Bacillota bacterium]|uniref:ATP-binding cassette domain-containing protein n=1 Tax=Thermanaerosceptrum fracticalcis TaxID=1712410 RepID=A0A7G6E4K1_THEFR|nr:ABC transporter ATP-binding protein [Thermanaerosceptrum fracticalcis]QNB47005.1 ATP-binding cassette domain-containing protein [Thermanaerosceptrum fracticalcis]